MSRLPKSHHVLPQCSVGPHNTPAAGPGPPNDSGSPIPSPGRTCGVLGGVPGALSFVFWRWFRRTVGFSVGASLSFLFVLLPVGEFPLRLSRALVNIEIASMLPKSQEREGNFSFPSRPRTLRGGPARDSRDALAGKTPPQRGCRSPNATTTQLGFFEDERQEKARAEIAPSYFWFGFGFFLHCWLRERRAPRAPRPEGGEG